MEFYSELPYEDFSYYNTPSTHEVGGSILTERLKSMWMISGN